MLERKKQYENNLVLYIFEHLKDCSRYPYSRYSWLLDTKSKWKNRYHNKIVSLKRIWPVNSIRAVPLATLGRADLGHRSIELCGSRSSSVYRTLMLQSKALLGRGNSGIEMATNRGKGRAIFNYFIMSVSCWWKTLWPASSNRRM